MLLAGLVVVAVPACSSDGAEREGGRISKAGSLSVFDFHVGDCFQVPGEIASELRSVRGVPCTEPHTLEVFAVEEYEDGDVFPGEEALDAFAQGRCAEAFEEYVGIEYLDSSLFLTYLLPSVRGWDERKDRNVVCVVTTAGEELTVSVRDSRR